MDYITTRLGQIRIWSINFSSIYVNAEFLSVFALNKISNTYSVYMYIADTSQLNV